MKKICHQCKKQYKVYPSRSNQKFCSEKCADNSREIKIDWHRYKDDKRSYKKIAKELGIHAKTIERHFKKLGFKKKWTLDKESVAKRALKITGDKHPNWKGDNVSYHRLHIWIGKNKPKPELCEECNLAPPYDLANISGEYKRDVNDFKWVCRKCHMKEDGRINNLLKGDPLAKRDDQGKFICREGLL